jgi:hypothetical protein
MMLGQLDLFAIMPASPPARISSPANEPLTDDERALQAALRLVAAGESIEWQILRHLVGAGYLHATTTRLVITDEGCAFLAITNGAE